MNLDKPLKLMAILAHADHEAFDASATVAWYAAEGIEVTVIAPASELADTDRIICDLVAHIRRTKPQVVLTCGPWDATGDDGRATASQLATAAAMPQRMHATATSAVRAVPTRYRSCTTRLQADRSRRVSTPMRSIDCSAQSTPTRVSRRISSRDCASRAASSPRRDGRIYRARACTLGVRARPADQGLDHVHWPYLVWQALFDGMVY